MVLAELGGSISKAIHRMTNATIINDKVLDECLNEIARALLQADVRFNLISDMQANIRKTVNLNNTAAGHNKRKIIQQAIFDELCNMLNPGKPPCFTPKKGETSVVIAGAFDQLKQNAAKVKIPFYGRPMESDPVKVAVEGVERFKKQNCDLIIVDTSGRHKQQAELFEEMRQVYEATKPDLVVFVMDSSIGQAAFEQARAFKQSVAVGAVIVTKMDGHAKGGGALSAVAATKSSQVFDVKPFVSRLLGMGGDLSGFIDKIHQVVPKDQKPEIGQKLLEGNFALRIMHEQFQNILKMGSFWAMGLMPKGSEKESQAKMKRYT
ncbi:hypothetical protein COLO4_12503 [Corchorus olitorius]|uniref:SRP54-type proteins GTP-binding domain-containing protein n=1 Tax=Corchorus olitorius TaxID=93759 RepID=A0A1R3K0Q0_9ROSI|nr:hypothetical protein COLO4_12503 [Corchorus olitorius]